MATQVLYRKWRPRTFQELVGQEHVTTVLRQAVRQGRVSHAYLFCGPRGTGKTSTARVLTKALNCLDPQDGEPDNLCSQCQNLGQGRSMDLIEMDAASNRGIDEIRSIREKVHFSPVESKYKVYIVDEAHMLTEAASNAFLKTLEEPPPHVIFVLCTTEPHKILPTIISRCQRFDFRRLSSETMVERLRFLCEQEGIEADSKVLEALARAAGGSLRDAENLLEQMVVSFGQKVELEAVREMLGLGHSQGAKDLVTYLLMGNTSSALGVIGRASQEGADLRQVHRQAVELLRAVLMVQSGAGDTLDIEKETLQDIEVLAKKVSLSRVMRCLKALGEINMRFDATATLPLELAVVEASLADDPEPAQPRPAQTPSSPTASTYRPPQPPVREHQVPRPPRREQPPVPEPVATTAPATEAGVNPSTTLSPQPATVSADVNGTEVPLEAWNQVVQVLRRHKGKRFFLGALLKDCKTPQLENGSIVLPFSHRSNMERMEAELEEVESREAIEKALQQFLGESYQIKLTLHGGASNSRPASVSSPLVRAARQMGGRILDERKIDE
ncbi:MAG: DNA polymerase III subunit gamma/tau [Chloroflexi bacterium]|nr:DNA polymerase III subunit gamma/tau [Chloroflexota bacterium]